MKVKVKKLLIKLLYITAITSIITINLENISKANDTEDFLDSSSYFVLEKKRQITNIVPETTITEFKKKFNQDENKIKVYKDNSSQELVTNGYIQTGMMVETEGIEGIYSTSVIGDLKEDGKMDQIDLSHLIRHIVGTNTIESTDIKSKSADVNQDKQINQIDITTLIRYIMLHELNVPEVTKTEAPEIIKSETQNQDGWNKTDIELTIGSNDQSNIESTVYSITGPKEVTNKEITGTETVKLTEDGEYNIVTYSYTKEGARTTEKRETIKIDKTAPEMTFETEATDTSIKVDVNANDNTSGIKKYTYYIGQKNGNSITYSNGVEKQESTHTFTGLTKDQEYFIKVEVEDNADNVTEVKDTSVKTTGAKVAPTFSITQPSGAIEVGKTATITIDYNGDGALTVESSDDTVATVSINDKTVTITGINAGTATITVKAAEGTNYLAGQDQTCNVTVVNAQATPTLILSESDIEEVAGNSVEIDITYNGNGNLTASSSKSSVANAEVNGTKLKIDCLKNGTSQITVTASETAEYKSATVQCDLTVYTANFSVGDVYYAELQKAVDNCPSNGTIKMLQSCSLTNGVGFNKNVTFNTNEKTLSGSKNLLYSTGSITINLTGNGTITSTVSGYGVIHMSNSSEWKINNVKIKNTGNGCSIISNDSGTSNITGCTLTGLVNITSGTVKISGNTTITSENVAGVQLNGGNLSVQDCSITGPAGILNNGGDVKVGSGATITGSKYEGIKQTSGYLTMTGGKISGKNYGVNILGGSYSKNGSVTIIGGENLNHE